MQNSLSIWCNALVFVDTHFDITNRNSNALRAVDFDYDCQHELQLAFNDEVSASNNIN